MHLEEPSHKKHSSYKRAITQKMESGPTRPDWSTTLHIFDGLSRVNRVIKPIFNPVRPISQKCLLNSMAILKKRECNGAVCLSLVLGNKCDQLM